MWNMCFAAYGNSFPDVIQRSVLIEGVLFRARYLGSTQLVCEGQPTKTTRMMQAEEAVSRIKVMHATTLKIPLRICMHLRLIKSFDPTS
jgi:hypothetical protein